MLIGASSGGWHTPPANTDSTLPRRREPSDARYSIPAYEQSASYRRDMGLRPISGAPSSVRVLDLFSGAGGLSAGFSQISSRFQVVRAVESDRAAAGSYAQNHAPDAVFSGTIQEWLKAETPPDADVVIGGPPCQGFSPLGNQDALDERNQLWLRYAETIRRVRPQYFLLENVPAFLKSVQFSRFKRQCQPKGPLGDYMFHAAILNAADYGAAQVRKRVVLLGHARDLPFPGFPIPTNARSDGNSLPGWRHLADALRGIPPYVVDTCLPDRQVELDGVTIPGAFKTSELHVTRHYEDLSLARFGTIPRGGNRHDIPDALLAPCWVKHKSGSGDVMGRLDWDKPSVTIRTEFFKPEKGRYLHPTENRAITHHEAARIQGFPDDYLWVGSKVAIARQIGNAVPVPLARALGQQILWAMG